MSWLIKQLSRHSDLLGSIHFDAPAVVIFVVVGVIDFRSCRAGDADSDYDCFDLSW